MKGIGVFGWNGLPWVQKSPATEQSQGFVVTLTPQIRKLGPFITGTSSAQVLIAKGLDQLYRTLHDEVKHLDVFVYAAISEPMKLTDCEKQFVYF